MRPFMKHPGPPRHEESKVENLVFGVFIAIIIIAGILLKACGG